MLLNLQEYIKKVKNGEKIKKRDIVLEFEENEIYEYLDDVNIRNIIQDTLDNICLIEIEMKTIKDYKISGMFENLRRNNYGNIQVRMNQSRKESSKIYNINQIKRTGYFII